jgi:hypothetical protein
VRTAALPENGFHDTIECKFVVAADKLKEQRGHDFKDTLLYYALLANDGTLNAARAQDAKAEDLALFIRNTGDSTQYALRMLASDSCRIAVVASDAAAFDGGMRNADFSGGQAVSGAQNEDFNSTNLADTINIPATGSISHTTPEYYAVKITYGTGASPKTYYGYLKVRTHMKPVGSLGETRYEFDRVEFSFKYGEARDYTKE